MRHKKMNTEKICRKCGNKLDQDSLFCSNCGEKYEVDSTINAMVYQAANEKRKKRGIVKKIVLAILIGAFLLFIVPFIAIEIITNKAEKKELNNAEINYISNYVTMPNVKKAMASSSNNMIKFLEGNWSEIGGDGYIIFHNHDVSTNILFISEVTGIEFDGYTAYRTKRNDQLTIDEYFAMKNNQQYVEEIYREKFNIDIVGKDIIELTVLSGDNSSHMLSREK